MAASVILFGLALRIALAGAAATESLGDVRLSSGVPPQFYFGGLFVAFYVIAVTFIAPRFGVGNAIFFVLVGQLVSAAAIDHFDLFGSLRFPTPATRTAAIALMNPALWPARRTGWPPFPFGPPP